MSQTTGILLDTTVLIDALRNRNQQRPLLVQMVVSGTSLATSTVNVAEIYGGLRPEEEQSTQALLADIDWLPVSALIAERAGRLQAELRRQGQTRSITDMIIAATALEHGLSVATDNRKDFQVSGLTFFPLD
jgi:predicted nucleic acid-binding protein